MNYPKLSVNDDLKIDWDDHHLVVFHFFRGDGKFLQLRKSTIVLLGQYCYVTFHLTSKKCIYIFNVVGESCTIRVWDISSEPKFLFAVEKGIECITDKVRTLLELCVLSHLCK